jgi:hypothetical protein
LLLHTIVALMKESILQVPPSSIWYPLFASQLLFT